MIILVVPPAAIAGFAAVRLFARSATGSADDGGR
jgi:hypothetical protein